MSGIVGAVTTADQSGNPSQGHLFYAIGDSAWWLLWVDNVDATKLRAARSTDLTTWTDKGVLLTTSFTMRRSGTDPALGANIGVNYKRVSSTDVVHLEIAQYASTTDCRSAHARATISAGTMTVTNAIAQVTQTTSGAGVVIPGGAAVQLDSAGKVYIADAWQEVGGTNNGNMSATVSSNADSGAAWTAGFATPVRIIASASHGPCHALADLGSGAILYIFPDSATADGTSTNIKWSKWTGSWSAAANVYGSAQTGFDDRDVGIVGRTLTDVHLVRRSGANTFDHQRFNGTAWAAGQAIPSQTSKAAGGMFLASDGTDVWLFVIDSDAANSIRSCKWSSASSTWGTWAALITSTATRTSLSGHQAAANQTIGLCWTEVASPFQLVTEVFATVAATPNPYRRLAAGRPSWRR